MRLLALGLAGLTSLAGHEPSPPLSAEPTAVGAPVGARPPMGSASWNSSAGNTTS